MLFFGLAHRQTKHVLEVHLQSVRLTNVVAKGEREEKSVCRPIQRPFFSLSLFLTALADMLRVNHTLRVLDLEDNKIDSDGIEYIAAALAKNQGLIELTLFKNRCDAANCLLVFSPQPRSEPGEKALSVLVKSFQFNTTLVRWIATRRALTMYIFWRVTAKNQLAPDVAPILCHHQVSGSQRRDFAPQKRRNGLLGH